MACPRCKGNNVVAQGKKKHKCLDCFKTFKYGVFSKDSQKDDALRVAAWLLMATGLNFMRDFSNDDPELRESSIIKEE